MNAPPPVRDNIVDDKGFRASRSWTAWFTFIHNIVADITSSGTTAQRPTLRLYINKPYFDTTLGKPIWWAGTAWVDGSGAPV
jgi:hypothetical protein